MGDCGQCKRPIGATAQTTLCNGFCNMTFHLECAGIDRTIANCIKKNPNIIWLCDICKDLMSNCSFMHLIKNCDPSTHQPQHNIVNDLQRLEEQIANNSKLIQEVCVQLKKQPVSSNTRSASSNFRSVSIDLTGSENGQDHPLNPPESSSSGNNHNVVIGTADMDPDIKFTSVAAKKMLFVSRVAATTSDEDFKKYVLDKFNVSESSCYRIVPRVFEDNPRDYVSYKITVSASDLEKLMSPCVWPAGILVKEFLNRPRRQNFSSQHQFRIQK